MKKQVVVIGLGRFGVSLADTLFGMGHDVLAIDIDEKKVQSIATQITHAVQADATSEAVLRELGIGNFDVAIVAIGTAIQSSVLATILLKKLGMRYVIARAENELHGSILDKIGADKVIYPEREMGTRLAHRLTLTDVLDYIPMGTNYGVAKLQAPPYCFGRTLADIGFGRGGRWSLAVLMLQSEKEIIVVPDRTETVAPGDILIVAGNDDKLEQFFIDAKKEKTKQ
ncbi:MAG: TrkA family potassium uptake protein [Chloroflexi bacterium]|nr:TrkA family potassium uptake protein [Chloroflexota bacterium]